MSADNSWPDAPVQLLEFVSNTVEMQAANDGGPSSNAQALLSACQSLLMNLMDGRWLPFSRRVSQRLTPKHGK